MTYSLWGIYSGYQRCILTGLDANKAAYYLVKMRGISRRPYWLESGE